MTNHKVWPQKEIAKMKGTREIRDQRSVEPQNGVVMNLLVMNFMFSKCKVHFQVSALISEKEYHYLFLFSSNILPLAPWLYSVKRFLSCFCTLSVSSFLKCWCSLGKSSTISNSQHFPLVD